jgi:hypothetical protein
MLSAFSSVAGALASDLEDRAAAGQVEGTGPLVEELESLAHELLRVTSDLTLEILRREAQTTGGPDET